MAVSTVASLGISPTPISPSGRSSCATNNQTNIASPPRIPAIATRLAMAPPPSAACQCALGPDSSLLLSLSPRRRRSLCLFVVLKVAQALQHRADNQWQRYGSIVEDFRELAAFFPRNEFPPQHGFRVCASAQPAPAHRLRTDAHPVIVAFQRKVLVASPREQLRVNAELLRPIARNAAAHGENPHALGLQHDAGKLLEIFEGVES